MSRSKGQYQRTADQEQKPARVVETAIICSLRGVSVRCMQLVVSLEPAHPAKVEDAEFPSRSFSLSLSLSLSLLERERVDVLSVLG